MVLIWMVNINITFLYNSFLHYHKHFPRGLFWTRTNFFLSSQCNSIFFLFFFSFFQLPTKSLFSFFFPFFLSFFFMLTQMVWIIFIQIIFIQTTLLCSQFAKMMPLFWTYRQAIGCNLHINNSVTFQNENYIRFNVKRDCFFIRLTLCKVTTCIFVDMR